MAILNYLKHFVQRGKCFGTKQIKFISPAKKKKPSLFFGNLKSDWILNLISRFEKKKLNPSSLWKTHLFQNKLQVIRLVK